MLEQVFVGKYKKLIVIMKKVNLLKHHSNVPHLVIIKSFVFLSEEDIYIVLF